MGQLRGLASSGRSLDDVAHFMDVERSVRRRQSSLERVAELDANLISVGGDPEALLKLSGEILQEKLTVKQVRDWMDLDNELLNKYGINHEDMGEIKKICLEYGGLANVREAVEAYGSIQDILAEERRVKNAYETIHKQLGEATTRLKENNEVLRGISQLYLLG